MMTDYVSWAPAGRLRAMAAAKPAAHNARLIRMTRYPPRRNGRLPLPMIVAPGDEISVCPRFQDSWLRQSVAWRLQCDWPASPKTRNPNIEIRNKHEIQNPKLE